MVSPLAAGCALALLTDDCFCLVLCVRGVVTCRAMTCRYHGNEVIEEDGRYKISLEIDQKLYFIAKLEILNVENTDQGTYRAVTKNKYGEGVATINLNFEGSDKPKYVFS